ncbi:MAG: hypothetical protein KAI16_00905 [Candidatus Pacebacteria bacterium]|nr:hypothetical protein [Candidatus Paceibacterota bacterium]
MQEYKKEREYGPIVAIIVILVVLSFSAYLIFSSAFENKGKEQILINKDNTEIYINKDDQEINLNEIDVEEISRRLNELDIDLDDVLKELDI